MRGWAILGLGLALGGCELPAESMDVEREDVPVFERASPSPSPPAAPKQLKVMTYNIKFGAARIDVFFDYWGDRVQLEPAEVGHNLAAIERLIDEVDPDVLIGQEVEVNSKRSAYVDMVQHILDGT